MCFPAHKWSLPWETVLQALLCEGTDSHPHGLITWGGSTSAHHALGVRVLTDTWLAGVHKHSAHRKPGIICKENYHYLQRQPFLTCYQPPKMMRSCLVFRIQPSIAFMCHTESPLNSSLDSGGSPPGITRPRLWSGLCLQP